MFEGDPVVPDSRLEQVATVLRQQYPDLPEAAQFVTWVADPEDARVKGIAVVARLARFGIVMPNPRHPWATKAVSASLLYDEFRRQDKDRKHYVGAPDPVLTAYTARPPGGRSVIEEAVNWSRNMAALS